MTAPAIAGAGELAGFSRVSVTNVVIVRHKYREFMDRTYNTFKAKRADDLLHADARSLLAN